MKTFDEVVSRVSKMDWLQKQFVYLRYCRRVFEANYWGFQFCNRGVPVAAEIKLEPISFDEFCSDRNIVITDMGESWQKQGFATRIRKEFKLDSIYRYIYLSL